MAAQAARSISLDDKYACEEGRIFLNGTQALVRLALLQRRADRQAGLNTSGFVTGYRGSPLGGVDMAFSQARRFTDAEDIRLQPAVNEDLAATMVLGTQQIDLDGQAARDGVFALWYAKGPGVDRSGDILRHGNLYGSAGHGGVLLLGGDDHTCKSSSIPHQSEFAFADAGIPVLHPANVGEIIDYGLFGWALSRFSGCWTAMKLTADTVDSAAVIEAVAPTPYRAPAEYGLPVGGLSIRRPDAPLEMERRLFEQKLPAVQAFARANRIDRITLGGPRRRLGVVTTGKASADLGEALELLGLGPRRAMELGLSVYRVGMVWPLEPEGLSAFATGLEEILVVEEKRPLVEAQVKDMLYNLPADRRPRVYGKRDAENRVILPPQGDLSPTLIARAIAARVLPWVGDAELIARIGRLAEVDPGALLALPPVQRTAFFCSGCPHNTSTQVPEGSQAMAGIGCHAMVQGMDRRTSSFVHMGGEGANWIGQAPFSKTPHMFQNLGDGTYFHSGSLAVRAAISAGVNITYKLLFNDAVAMTGGQPVDGVTSPQAISWQMQAEGIRRIAVVSDDAEKYKNQPPFAPGVTFHPREDLDAVQRSLREVTGVSLLIYDQVCAAEKRRRRKRGLMVDPPKRVLINELVCEGCGDCSAKSNCLSVVPLETPFGRKRAIDQSSCNKDYSCTTGFCPSFVTVTGGTLRRGAAADIAGLEARTKDLTEPAGPSIGDGYDILVTGVGGTGVVTIGALLAMAAHLQGLGATTLDMTGLAQKGGPVTTHLRLSPIVGADRSSRICPGGADLLLGCDMVTAAGQEAVAALAKDRARVVLNTEETITGAFVRNPDFSIPMRRLIERLSGAVGRDQVESLPASELGRALLGDAIAANLLLVGYAFQRGLIPLAGGSIEQAIDLNGAAVAMNLSAFRLGRLYAAQPQAVLALTGVRPPANEPEGLDQIVDRRAAFLIDYQSQAYATSYRQFVATAADADTRVKGAPGAFAEAVARSLFKLMAYKDEYEVARLYAGEVFRKQLAETFEGDPRLTFHLAPPLVPFGRDAEGAPRKRAFGPWMMHGFRLLSRLKGLRGTPFDPFGWTAERRGERALIGDYRALAADLAAGLSARDYAERVALAQSAQLIRGYGHVRATKAAEVKALWARGVPSPLQQAA